MSESYLAHHGIKGQKWGVRRYRNEDGTLTDAGKERYAYKTKDEIDPSLNGASRIWASNRLSKKNADRVVVDGNWAAYTLKDGKLAQIDESDMRSISDRDKQKFADLARKARIASRPKEAEYYKKKAQKIIDEYADAKLTDLNHLRIWGGLAASLDFSEFERRLK
jgi:hypothetical protein